jgi:hypothetical protein
LYLVKKYVELLAGDLTLESEKNAFFKARIELPATCLSRYRDAALIRFSTPPRPPHARDAVRRIERQRQIFGYCRPNPQSLQNR